MIILLLVSFPILIKSHIVWTYPPARYIPIDFLDKSRTESPCGVPRPQNPVYTDFTVGQALNVTWRMAFPHKGGYRIKLLNSAGEILETIVPENDTGFSHHNDETVENSYIVFNKPCEHCTLLLERQALEWGESYLFHTCADINVIPMMESVEEQCSGRGTWRQGKCHCRHLYSGNVCQYKSDCREDDECLNNGKCVTDLGSMSSKTCYCSFGYFGRNCDRKYEESPTNDECFNYNYPTNESAYAQYGLFNAKCFKKHTLTNDDVVYSRVIGSDVEIILDYKSNSWIALGWRPTQIDRSCRLFPDLEHVRWKRETNGNSPHRMPTEIPTKRTTEPTLAPVKSPELPKNNGFFESALLAPLHAMDCTDIVVGSVEDGRSRINDMYTRDRSTPLRDVWFDGEESFIAAYGMERNDRTIIMFRRMISEIEPSDHPLGPGKLFAIFAKGQTFVNGHISKSGQSHADFYQKDQLQYHGPHNRGSIQLEFVSKNDIPPTVPPPLFRPRKLTTKTSSVTTSGLAISSVTRKPVQKSKANNEDSTDEEDGMLSTKDHRQVSDDEVDRSSASRKTSGFMVVILVIWNLLKV